MGVTDWLRGKKFGPAAFAASIARTGASRARQKKKRDQPSKKGEGIPTEGLRNSKKKVTQLAKRELSKVLAPLETEYFHLRNKRRRGGGSTKRFWIGKGGEARVYALAATSAKHRPLRDRLRTGGAPRREIQNTKREAEV